MSKKNVEVPSVINFDPVTNAVDKEKMPVRNEFDVDELEKIKGKHFDTARLLHIKEEEKKAFVDKINADIKGLKNTAKNLMSQARKGYEEKEEEVYLVPDHDLGMMLYVASDKRVVSHRRLRPDERNETVMSMLPKTGTENK